jgi:hypothetical protein
MSPFPQEQKMRDLRGFWGWQGDHRRESEPDPGLFWHVPDTPVVWVLRDEIITNLAGKIG